MTPKLTCTIKTCEEHMHCPWCGSIKTESWIDSNWYYCKSCRKQYEEHDVQKACGV